MEKQNTTQKTFKVSLTELVTYSKVIEADTAEEALDLMQSNYRPEDEVSTEYHSEEINELATQ